MLSDFGAGCKTAERSVVFKLKIEMFMVRNYWENVCIGIVYLTKSYLQCNQGKRKQRHKQERKTENLVSFLKCVRVLQLNLSLITEN